MIPKRVKVVIDTRRNFGKKIGFINGCFDLFHEGHMNLIEKAYEHCDCLIAGINSDESVRSLKGPGRPCNDAEFRAYTLSAAMRDSDYVFIFNDERQLLDLIKEINPHVMVKGDTYEHADIVGADHIIKNGGKIVFVPRLKGVSTSTKMQERKNAK